MKKVLVMGGSYFIGKKIVDMLVDAGYDVTILNRGSKKIQNTKIRQIICDRNNKNDMYTKLRNLNFDIIIDVSGVNKNQLQILCESVDVNKLSHFIFISSSAVYCVEDISIPFSETDKLGQNIWGDYGKNKIEAEKYLETIFENSSVNLIMLRPPYVYGENNYAQRESFIFDHIYNDKPILIPHTNPQLQFIYTTDLGNTIIALLKTSIPSSISIFNVGNEKPYTAKEWVIACGKAIGKTPEIIEYNYLKGNRAVRDFFPFLDYDNVLDVSKIKNIYPTETPFADGLKNAYEWYLSEKDTISFKDEVLKNENEILNSLHYVK